ncbi:MAG: NADH-quinone oxidoreductase subunit C [Acidobacteriia bacterium]|nr:NADH-quinone oxidoreductase subunit C [Terriglobia bacterium]
MLSDQLNQIRVVQALEAFAGAVLDGKLDRNELTLHIAPERIVEVCRFLKTGQQFVRLSGITAVDWHPMEPRFEVVYHLHSMERNERLRLTCRLDGAQPGIDSVFSVWRAADWYEREIFDLFGVTFRNHPNLIRILMPEDWVGHPLRKDFPIHGHKYSYKDG